MGVVNVSPSHSSAFGTLNHLEGLYDHHKALNSWFIGIISKHIFTMFCWLQALSAAEQGEKDPLARTSSTISLQLIMQSEAAGMFNSTMSGDAGHAMLAATVAGRQNEHEADQEAATQQNARQEAGSVDELGISHDQFQGNSARVGRDEPEAAVQRPKAHSWDQTRAEPPGLTGDSPHDAPGQMSSMHSGELVLSVTPILGSTDDLVGRHG